jgi:hypothetical protein
VPVEAERVKGSKAMIRRLGIISFAVVALAIQTAPAWGEGAWVLWFEQKHHFLGYRTADVKTDQDQNQSWTIVGSYANKSDCDLQQKSEIDSLLKQWRSDPPGGPSTTKITIDHSPSANIITKTVDVRNQHYTSTSRESLRHLCLPDTIDPRGPKGSMR